VTLTENRVNCWNPSVSFLEKKERKRKQNSYKERKRKQNSYYDD